MRLSEKAWWPGMGLLLLGALWLRWPVPSPEWTHIDERVFLLNPLKLWSGDLNPHFFIYPTLHIYLCSALYYIYFLFWHNEPIGAFIAYRFFVDGGDLLAIARAFNAVLSAATAVVVATTGRRIYGVLAGSLAGVFFAVMPLSVRFAHLATTDSPAAWWAAFALYGAIRVLQCGRSIDYVLAGVSAGLAGATKYPAAMVCLPLAVACWLRTPTLRAHGLWLSGGLALATFAFTSPYVLLDIGAALEDLALMGRVHLMSDEATTDMASGWYYLRYALGHGIGLIGLLSAVVSCAWPRKSREEWVLVTATAAFAVLLVAAESVFMRYALPLAPLCALWCARWAICGRRWLVAMGAVALLVQPFHASLQTRALLAGEDTREQAELWLAKHARDGAWIVNVPSLVGGNIEVLYPEKIFAREQRFAHSFSGRSLIDAYAGLAMREDMPPLYAFLQPNALDLAPADSAGAGIAYVLHYQHPVLPPIEGVAAQTVLARGEWVAEFSPGAMQRAVYEPVDWYFAPIGSYAGVERTGSHIRLAKVALREPGGQGDSRALFAILHGILRGKLLTVEGTWEQALAQYEQVARSPLSLPKVLNGSYYYEYLYSHGLCLSKVGRLSRAVVLWEQALAIKDGEAELHNNIGVAYARLGRDDYAVRHLTKATVLDSHYVEAYANLGNVLYRLGDRTGAAAAWQQTIAVKPDHAKAHFNMGNIYYERGEWNRAIRSYKQAVTLRQSRVYFNLAQAYLRKAKLDSAIDALSQAAAIEPNDAEVHFYLGTLLAQKDDQGSALRHFARALELEPDNPRTAQIKAYMGER